MSRVVGKYTYGHELIREDQPNYADLIIGAFCSIGGGLTVFSTDHRLDWATTYPFGHVFQTTFSSFDGKGHPRTRGNVVIGNDVWIGNNATIMAGVHVGDGAVIAANAHVVKNVEPYAVVGGNPARLIRKRFSDSDISRLLKLQWWNMEDSVINEIAPLLCSSNLESLFTKFGIVCEK